MHLLLTLIVALLLPADDTKKPNPAAGPDEKKDDEAG